MNHTNNIIAFSKELTWDDLSFGVRDYTKLCLLSSTWFEPKWDASEPPTNKELTKKFRDYATPVVGKSRTKAIYEAVFNLARSDTQQLFRLISVPIQKPVANVS